jgi:hypothetical protein
VPALETVKAVRAEERAAGVVEKVVLEGGLIGFAGGAEGVAVDGGIGGGTADDVIDKQGRRAAVAVEVWIRIDLGDQGACGVALDAQYLVVVNRIVGNEDSDVCARVRQTVYSEPAAAATGAVPIDQILNDGNARTALHVDAAAEAANGRIVADDVVHHDGGSALNDNSRTTAATYVPVGFHVVLDGIAKDQG